MKKLLLVICLAFVSTAAFAQVNVGIKAGFSMTTFIGDENAQAKPGFKLGVVSDIFVTDADFIQPSLMLSARGAKYKSGVLGLTSNNMSVNSLYIELPVLVGAKIWLDNYRRISLGAGPYIAYGVGGKTVYDGRIIGIGVIDRSTSTFGDLVNMNRFDAGIAAAAAFESGNFFIGLEAQMGLTKLSTSWAPLIDNNAKNMTATIFVGFKF